MKAPRAGVGRVDSPVVSMALTVLVMLPPPPAGDAVHLQFRPLQAQGRGSQGRTISEFPGSEARGHTTLVHRAVNVLDSRCPPSFFASTQRPHGSDCTGWCSACLGPDQDTPTGGT